MSEIWKAIPGYPDYQASSKGRMKSIKWGRERILKNSSSKYGYLVINSCHNGILKLLKVHVAVALCFHGERPEGLVIDHKDHDKSNNDESNLQYITHRENTNKDRLSKSPLGASLHNKTNRWRARIEIKGKEISLGYFDTAKEAGLAYQIALAKIS